MGTLFRTLLHYLEHYLTMCAHNEHFLEYREIVKEQIETQLAEYLAQKS